MAQRNRWFTWVYLLKMVDFPIGGFSPYPSEKYGKIIQMEK
jgi:hypothetical protein